MESMKVRISYDDGPDGAVSLLERLVKFFGGELIDLSVDGNTWVEYEVRKKSDEAEGK